MSMPGQAGAAFRLGDGNYLWLKQLTAFAGQCYG
jgi:hypothetical protein